jgi:hypothetical protein
MPSSATRVSCAFGSVAVALVPESHLRVLSARERADERRVKRRHLRLVREGPGEATDGCGACPQLSALQEQNQQLRRYVAVIEELAREANDSTS